MRSRRNEAAPVTLFSFQDIITSVMGIMILVMLVIALELAARQLQSPAVQQAIVREDVREALANARIRLAQVRSALASGRWDDLAALSRGDVEREAVELNRLLPLLEQDLSRAETQVAQLHRREDEANAASEEQRTDEDLLARLREELAAIEQELSRLVNSTTLFFRPSATGGKAVWLVELSGDSILAAPLGPTARPHSFAGATPVSRRRQFLAWVTERDPSREYFVILVKPSGARLYPEIERELRSKRFDVGLDLIDTSQTPIDPERGAPVVPTGGEGT